MIVFHNEMVLFPASGQENVFKRGVWKKVIWYFCNDNPLSFIFCENIQFLCGLRTQWSKVWLRLIVINVDYNYKTKVVGETHQCLFILKAHHANL